MVEIRSLLHELADRHGTTVFLSSHVLAEVARLATRIGIIHDGRLLQELGAGELAHLVRQKLVVTARDGVRARRVLEAAGLPVEPADDGSLLVNDPGAVERPDDVATMLVTAGCPPTRLVVEREDLESYFLRTVGATGATAGGGMGDA